MQANDGLELRPSTVHLLTSAARLHPKVLCRPCAGGWCRSNLTSQHRRPTARCGRPRGHAAQPMAASGPESCGARGLWGQRHLERRPRRANGAGSDRSARSQAHLAPPPPLQPPLIPSQPPTALCHCGRRRWIASGGGAGSRHRCCSRRRRARSADLPAGSRARRPATVGAGRLLRIPRNPDA